VIIFKHLTYRNVLSYGNVPVTVDLECVDTSIIVGTNGEGKSTMLDALSYALYGKPFRKIKLTELINRYNQKKLEVSLDFSVDGVEYTVHRGMKPNKFDILIDGKERVHDASVRDQQEWLEGVLGMNEKSFRQIIVLGSGNYTPFMQLTTSDRRKVIEQLLDIEIFSLMNFVLKEKVHTINNDLSSVERCRDILEREIETDRKHIQANDVKRSVSSQKIDDEVTTLEGDIEELNNINKTINVENMTAIEGKRQKIVEVQSATRNKIRHHTNFINTITNAGDVCPTCTQDITDDFRTTFIDTNTSKITDLEVNVDKMGSMLDELDEQIGINQNNSEILKTNESDISTKLNIIKRLRASKDFEDDSELKRDVDRKDSELKDLRREVSHINRTVGHYGTIEMMLKDSGIKAKIIKKYLPVLNNIINKYLRSFEFNVVMKLDETFSETITQNGRELGGYMTFSEGEKLRMDLAVLFAFRELARVKNSVHTNLLVMDEVLDKSLDNTGIEHFLEVIRELDKSRVFVISHKPDMRDKFNRVLEVRKNGQFSEMAETFL
jgi:DNA repair exonuclease SbcCD ATPase subunit